MKNQSFRKVKKNQAYRSNLRVIARLKLNTLFTFSTYKKNNDCKSLF